MTELQIMVNGDERRVPGPAAGRPGWDAVGYTLPTIRKFAPSAAACSASLAECTDLPIQPTGNTARASPGRRSEPPSWTPCAPTD